MNFRATYELIGAFCGLFLCLTPSIVDARPLLLTSEQASATSGDLTVYVKPGHPLPISFQNGSERIYKVWFSKPSAIQVEGDVPLCSNSSCSADGASILYLRIPPGVKIDGQTLTISTTDGDRGHLYNLKLVASNNPHSVVSISPNRTEPLASSLPTVFNPLSVEKGLSKAGDSIEPELESQIRKFLAVYTGENLQQALQESGLSLETIQKLQSLAGS